MKFSSSEQKDLFLKLLEKWKRSTSNLTRTTVYDKVISLTKAKNIDQSFEIC